MTLPSGSAPAPPHRYSRLLLCLVALPVAEALSVGYPPLEFSYWIAFLAVLIGGLYTIDPDDRSRLDEWAVILPAAIALASIPIVGILPRHHAPLWIFFRYGAGLFALGMLAFRILRDVLRTRVIVFEQICGGLCVYILIGFACALTYSGLERLQPGSFAIDRIRYGLVDDFEFFVRLRSLMTYFSFITLTTLGFGDIAPVADLPRALVAVEAVFGQIYMAVFVARLVSLNLASASATVSVEPPKPATSASTSAPHFSPRARTSSPNTPH